MMSENGNGKHGSQVTIDTVDNQDKRYAFFCAGKNPPKNEALPELLNRTLQKWIEENDGKRVRSTLGIVQGGDTVAIYAWHELVTQSEK
jgi:hypothetical protein